MTREAVHSGYTAPILVLALGDVGSGDQGGGAALGSELTDRYRCAGGFIEFIDGGTHGLELLSQIAGRHAGEFHCQELPESGPVAFTQHPSPTGLDLSSEL